MPKRNDLKPATAASAATKPVIEIGPKDISKMSQEQLREEYNRLAAALEMEQQKNTDLEAQKNSDAEAFAMQMSNIREVPTGEKKKIRKCTGYEVVGYKDDGREIRKPIFEQIEVPTFWYKIDVPPSAGLGITISGNQFYHGETYKFTEDELRTVKDMVHRCFVHENIRLGRNEAPYRKEREHTLSMRGF